MPTDPFDPAYRNEKATRDELTRTFDVCVGCRRCVELCGSFPRLFDLVAEVGDAGQLTPAQQDGIVDDCFHCGACASICPYAPGQHELAIDVPRLMLRTEAMRTFAGQRSFARSRSVAFLTRPDRVGRVGVALGPIANRFVSAPAGSLRRRALSLLTGVSAQRSLPSFAPKRFSRWFRDRVQTSPGTGARSVVLYPTCLVEYGDTQLGRDIVRAYEELGVTCVLSGAGCCGAAALHAGELDRFAKISDANLPVLAGEVRGHGTVVVAQPACAMVLREHMVDVAESASPGDQAVIGGGVVDVAVHLDVVRREAGDLADSDARSPIAGSSVWGLRAANDQVVAAHIDRVAERSDVERADVEPTHPVQGEATPDDDTA